MTNRETALAKITEAADDWQATFGQPHDADTEWLLSLFDRYGDIAKAHRHQDIAWRIPREVAALAGDCVRWLEQMANEDQAIDS